MAFAEHTTFGILATLVLVCSAAAYNWLQKTPVLLLTPLPWMLLSSGAYFGFGPLLYYCGPERAKEICEDVWPITSLDIFKVSCLNAVGISLVVGAWIWRTRPFGPLSPELFTPVATGRAILGFYLIGLPARAITLLGNWGLVEEVIPGFLGWIGNFTGGGLVLLTLSALRCGGVWWVFFGAMLLLELVGSISTFSKGALILSFVPCIIGYVLHRRKLRMLGWVPIFFVIAYLGSNLFVAFGRRQIWCGDSIANRLGVAKSFFTSREINGEQPDDQPWSWWVRLNYANAQAFALKEYDDGQPGHSLALALVAPIPRILWPSKPIVESGYAFYRRLTGQQTASFGIGIFAEAYWNGGWVCLLLTSIAVGWIFGTVTVLIHQELARGNVWILPIAMLWVKSGGRVDGWIHTEIAGPAAFTLLYVVVLRTLQRTGSVPSGFQHPNQPVASHDHADLA